MNNKSKQWWRWLLFIPAGLAFFFISVVIGKLINYLSTFGFLGFANGILFTLSQIFVEVAMLYGSAGIAAIVSPNNKTGGIIYSSIMLIAFGASLVLGIIHHQNWSYYVTMSGSVIAMIYAIIQASNDELGN